MTLEDREETLLLRDLVSIYSPSGREARIARYLYERMSSDFSFDDVKLDNVGNVIGVYEGEEPTILLCGHMDTVPGRLPVRISNGVLHGRGAVDAKGSLAALILAAHRLRTSGYTGKLIVAGVVDEEGRGTGAKHLVRSRVEADYAIFGEPSGLTHVTIGYKGRIQLKITVETEGFHASSPWLGKSALQHAMDIWRIIREYIERDGRGRESRFDSLSSCVTMLHSGVATNVASPSCTFVVDMRVPPRLRAYEVVNEVVTAIKGYVESSEERFDVHVVPEEVTEAFTASRSSPVVSALSAAILKVTGSRAHLVRKTGTGDMNILGFSLSIPTATYGPGDPKLSHTGREMIRLDEYLTSISVIEEAVRILYSRSRQK